MSAVAELITVAAYVVAVIGWGVTLCLPWRRDEVQFGRFGGLRAWAGIAVAGVVAVLAAQAAASIAVLLCRVNTWLTAQQLLEGTAAAARLVVLTLAVVIGGCLGIAALGLVGQVTLVLAWALFGGLAAAQVRLVRVGWFPRWEGLNWSGWVRLAMLAALLVGQVPLRPRAQSARLALEVAQALDLVVLLAALPWLLWQLVRCVAARPAASAVSALTGGTPAAVTAPRPGVLGGGAADRSDCGGFTAPQGVAADRAADWITTDRREG